MINIVIPMAGRGQRFLEANYQLPKPLILINGKPMIELVVHNLMPSREHRFIFIIRKEHQEKYGFAHYLKRISPDCQVVTVDRVTEGAACTVLMAEPYINNEDELMIANCDQWIDTNIDDYLLELHKRKAAGLIMTMKASDSKWSYVKCDGNGEVTEVAEKIVVSEEATVGIYNFANGNDFVKAAKVMIERNLRVNNEFYVAPVYNILIEKKAKIVTYNIGKVMDGMYGLGTPEDLEQFLHTDKADQAVRNPGK